MQKVYTITITILIWTVHSCCQFLLLALCCRVDLMPDLSVTSVPRINANNALLLSEQNLDLVEDSMVKFWSEKKLLELT